MRSWEEMTLGERTAWIGEKVLNWTIVGNAEQQAGARQRGIGLPPDKQACSICSVMPSYPTDAKADYEVLEHVRKTWRGELLSLFRQKLAAIWMSREIEAEEEMECIVTNYGFLYQAGDYSKAAFDALQEFNKNHD